MSRGGTDVGRLLREVRERHGLSQRVLATRAGVARSTLSAYETGASSPTLRQLDQVLAGAGLQLRPTLEPLTADLDLLLDAALDPEPDEDAAFRRQVSLGALPGSLRAEGVRWAVDGHTALALHGLPVVHRGIGLALVDDGAARLWMHRSWLQARYGWLDASREQLEQTFQDVLYSRHGFVRLRLVDELGPTVLVEHEGTGVPVLPLPVVCEAHGAVAELVQRWRERRGRPAPTG